VEGEEVIGTGVTVVDYVHGKADFFLPDGAGSGNVGRVTANGEGSDLGRAKRHS